ncbi:MAG: cytochrome c, partial [Anaerolineales bacterium]
MRRCFALVAGLAVLLSACEFSLAGDVTPPPEALISGNATLVPIAGPVSRPDLQAGATIYAQSCEPCHGDRGQGDGEQGTQLPFAPSPLGDADLARAASPEDWYRWVTEGRFTRYMPPFASLLSPQERWDVLAFVYTLSLEEADFLSGEALFSQYQEEVNELLAGDLKSAKLATIQSLGLSNEQSNSLTAYMQARALGIEDLRDLNLGASNLPNEANVDLPELGSFAGEVLHGSQANLPAGLEVTLVGYDRTEQVFSQNVELDANGRFKFDEVPLANEHTYFVQVHYEGQIYFSEFINASGEQNEFTLPITVYETTTSIEQLAVESLQLFFDFSKQDVVRIAHQVSISNLGARVVVPQQDGTPVLHFSIPADAGNLAFQEGVLGERYVADETGFGDLRGVLPGASSYQLLFAYELPYSDSLDLTLSIDLPTRALAAFLPEGEFELQSEAFQLVGSQLIEGIAYSVYSASPGYFPDEVLQLS